MANTMIQFTWEMVYHKARTPSQEIHDAFKIIRSCYLWDTFMSMTLSCISSKKVQQFLAQIERCLTDTERWMHTNVLNLNSDKIGVMLFTSKQNAITVTVGYIGIISANSVRNSDIIFKSVMNMEQQLICVCMSGFYQLCNIVYIRCYLTNAETQ